MTAYIKESYHEAVQINEEHKLVLAVENLYWVREVHKTELSGGTTVIDTETSKIMFLTLKMM